MVKLYSMQGVKKQDLKDDKHIFRPFQAFPIKWPNQKYVPVGLLPWCLAQLCWTSNNWIYVHFYLLKMLRVFEWPEGNSEIPSSCVLKVLYLCSYSYNYCSIYCFWIILVSGPEQGSYYWFSVSEDEKVTYSQT